MGGAYVSEIEGEKGNLQELEKKRERSEVPMSNMSLSISKGGKAGEIPHWKQPTSILSTKMHLPIQLTLFKLSLCFHH